MTEYPTQERTQGEIPEISAFRYTAASDKTSLNPLNLNGLRFGVKRRTLSERLLHGVRILVSTRPEPTVMQAPEPKSENMGVLQYHMPIQEYRARRRRNAEQSRRIALGAGLAVTVSLLAITAFKHMPAPKPHALMYGPPAPAVAAKPVSTTQAAVKTPQTAHTATVVSNSYQVAEGDTLSGIAHRHHVKVRALLAANGLDSSHRLKIGESLKIPAPGDVVTSASQLAAHEASGTQTAHVVAAAPVHAVSAQPSAKKHAKKTPEKRTKRTHYVIQNGDTLSTIAERFGVTAGAIVEINDLDFETPLRIGRKLLIPPNVETHSTKSDDSDRNYRHRTKHKVASRGLMGDLGRIVSRHFLWPTMGRVSSYFGMRSDHFHTGLDIPNHPGAPIHASKAGVVVSAGWQNGYGKTVDISHGSGVVTRYAHCSKLLVHAGERVGQGETIALVGESGHATGPHLHYEVRVNGRPVDPEKFF